MGSTLLKLYGDDLPFSRGLDSEMDMWKIKWTKMPSEANELDTPEKVEVSPLHYWLLNKFLKNIEARFLRHYNSVS